MVESVGHGLEARALHHAPLYFLNSDVALPVRLRIGEVRGTFPPDEPAAAAGAAAAALHGQMAESGGSFAERFARRVGAASADVHVSCQLYSRGRPLCAPLCTASACGELLRWGEWLCFPAAYRDLGADAEVRIALYAPRGPGTAVCAGRASLRLFNEQGQLRVGQKELSLLLDGHEPLEPAGARAARAGAGAAHGVAHGAQHAPSPTALGTVAAPGCAQAGAGVAVGAGVAGGAGSAGGALEAELIRIERALRHRELAAARWTAVGCSAGASTCAGGCGGVGAVDYVTSAAGAGCAGGSGGGSGASIGALSLGGALGCADSGEAALMQQQQQQQQQLPWLDRLVYRELERLQAACAHERPRLLLVVELPRVEHALRHAAAVHGEAQRSEARAGAELDGGADDAVAEAVAAAAAAASSSAWWRRTADCGVGQDNAAQLKALKLARATPADEEGLRAAAPDAAERAELRRLLSVPVSYHLTPAQRELFWRMRTALLGESRALGKFLRAVDWLDAREVAHVRWLLPRWAPPDAEGAVELLGRPFAHAAPVVREYAVVMLARASDAQLLALLLPLVQALRYDDVHETPAGRDAQAAVAVASGAPAASAAPAARDGAGERATLSPLSPLGALLVRRACSHVPTAVALHWYLLVEIRHARMAAGLLAGADGGSAAAWAAADGAQDGGVRAARAAAAKAAAAAAGAAPAPRDAATVAADADAAAAADADADEAPLGSAGGMFQRVHRALLGALGRTAAGRRTVRALGRQVAFVRALSALSRAVRASAEVRPRKVERLRAQLGAEGSELLRALAPCDGQPALPLPIDPTVRATGVLCEGCTIYKSALSPLGICLRVCDDDEPDTPLDEHADVDERGAAAAATAAAPAAAAPAGAASRGGGGGRPPPRRLARADASLYRIIFKSGDDLRQDQLVTQVVALMDALLKREGFDLRLTPYMVLPTGCREGIVQVVDRSFALADVLAQYRGDIRQFLRAHHPSESGRYGIRPDVLDAFVKSCAGYCVITYLLSVGDRHLDNLMLTTGGELFHIDFGYILGRDPKPLPPPMKLCREMVEAMGGAHSADYHDFKATCCEAFNLLRKSSALISNLFTLMVDAGIHDLGSEHDIAKLQERFRLDLSDEEAVHFFQQVINDSVSALFPQVTETIHRWAQYWRS
ncbi:hypothetical protein KFE25_011276 [Diacronema lutheri]|uniref:phosphatidylinositol 3-kinase n=1 Tax=Diacronema lutheri TaxID=2081491 RepID=A0A8J5X062_DIALT|nr:hypothetical protein KFE25_011276 [Diacronema lutheri]